jgi:formylglycine-generating enzyme required for sulfatase activity
MELVLVPQGSFIMGAQEGDWAAGEEEGPRHEVSLDAFWIDRTEVTNAMYTLCVDADVCPVPEQKKSSTRALYYNDPMYANYPVINIPWEAADAYCRWAGRRLPTEAGRRRRRAAGWTDLSVGRSAPRRDRRCSTTGWLGDTARVGNFLMAPVSTAPGIWQKCMGWVADWYSDSYYSVSQVLNPTGPKQGDFRRAAVRGTLRSILCAPQRVFAAFR